MHQNDSPNYKTRINPLADALMMNMVVRSEIQAAADSDLKTEFGENLQFALSHYKESTLSGEQQHIATVLEGVAKRLIELDVHDQKLTDQINEIFSEFCDTKLLQEVTPDVHIFELPKVATNV